MSSQDILICEKDIKVLMLEKKVNELEKDIMHMKEALTNYHLNKENHNHTTTILEILTRLLYLKKEKTVEQQMESTLSDYCFCGLHCQNKIGLSLLLYL